MNESLDQRTFSTLTYPIPEALEKKRYLLGRNEESELILMIWGKGAKSPIHDHGGSECWTVVVSGELVEKRFSIDTLELLSEEIIGADETSYVEKESGVHQLVNESSQLVYTLHLYKAPLPFCRVYDEETSNWSILDNHFDNFKEDYL